MDGLLCMASLFVSHSGNDPVITAHCVRTALYNYMEEDMIARDCVTTFHPLKGEVVWSC